MDSKRFPAAFTSLGHRQKHPAHPVRTDNVKCVCGKALGLADREAPEHRKVLTGERWVECDCGRAYVKRPIRPLPHGP